MSSARGAKQYLDSDNPRLDGGLAQNLVNGTNGSLADLWTHSSLMSAFLESGRSDQQKSEKIRVRFRPKAAGYKPVHGC